MLGMLSPEAQRHSSLTLEARDANGRQIERRWWTGACSGMFPPPLAPSPWEGLTRPRTTDSKTMKAPNHCVVKMEA